MGGVLGLLAPGQVLFDGVVNGLIYGLVGMGVVLVYRSTRVINFAVGAMGLPAAALFVLLVVQYGFAYWLALPLALIAGTAFGAAVELIVVRRLFTAPRVILLVATVGVAQVAQAVAMSLPSVDDISVRFPLARTTPITIGSIVVRGADQMVLVVVPLAALGLGWLLTRTGFGRKVNAAADNPDLARLSGVNPKVVSTVVWTMAGLLASVSLILIAGRVGNITKVATLGPATLGRGLIVAVIAGLVSFPRVLLAGIAIGLIESVVGFRSIADPGRIDSLLLVTVLVVVYLQSRRESSSERSVFSFAARERPVPAAIADRWWVRNLGRITFVAFVAVAAAVPLVVTTPSRVFLYAGILCFAIAALSVSIVTGWSGQLSLAQMGFAGVGGLGAAALVRGDAYQISVGGGRVLILGGQPLTVPMAAIVMAGVCAVVAAVVGLGALRVRGLLLGISTFVFAYACQQYLFRTGLLTGGMQSPIAAPRGTFGSLDLNDQRTYYWLVLTALTVVLSVVARLRRRTPGRTMVAVRDNADTAAAYTVSLARTRLSGYALSGAVAGLAGALLGGLYQSINTNEVFTVDDSLAVVSMAVIGGLGSMTGPILGALWVKGLPAFFPGNDLVPLFSSGVGLLVLLLYVPGGLVQLAYSARDAVFDRLAARLPEPASRPRPALAARPAAGGDHDPTHPEGPALAAEGVRVHFGGLTAVDGVDLVVQPGEVVGLIGTNGAGKSTLLNALGGYVPAEGTVSVLGTDVSKLAAHRRAKAGLGRTFQAATLFPELTVQETLMVALQARRRAGMVSHALALPHAGRVERANRAEARDLVDLLGLGSYADMTIDSLSTGTRRIVEVAGLLALGTKVLCLDEPTAGVAQRESEAFGPLVLAIRKELDASVLVIEHDMPLIMSMSDRIYCLDTGRVIAEGTPDEVRSDPAVIASYLGTDERAINRSDARTEPVGAPIAPASTDPT